MKNYIVTGATGGLGWEITRQLAKDPSSHVVMAVRNCTKAMEMAATLGNNLEVLGLDLSSLEDVDRFISQWKLPISGLINNAGIQKVLGTSYTQDGFEETVAVNHLAAFKLTMGLRSYLTGGRVLFIGSGTHHPEYPLNRLFGFQGAIPDSLISLLMGSTNQESEPQANRDRYATSKLFNIQTAVEMADLYKEFHTYVLDPGLMPGTQLARGQNWMKRFLWERIMPIFRWMLPDTSSPKKSAAAAVWIMRTPTLDGKSGSILSFNRKPYRHVWKEQVYNQSLRRELFLRSQEVLLQFEQPLQKG